MAKFGFFVMVAIFVAMVFNVGLSNPKTKTDDHGRSSIRRKKIVNGEDAAPHEFPWTVLILIQLVNGHVMYCSGSLISPRVVLTAAHCIRRESQSGHIAAKRANVYPGWHHFPLEVDRPSTPLERGVATGTEEFDLPPLPKPYRNYTFYDYGVVILHTRFTRSKTVDYIPLANNRSPSAQRLLCFAAGFGGIKFENMTIMEKLRNASDIRKLKQYKDSLTPDVLQKERYKVLPMKRCYEDAKKFFMKFKNGTELQAEGYIKKLKPMERSLLCVLPFRKSSGVTHGDSGGPFMCRSRSGPWVLYGVMSQFVEGPQSDFALFAKVSEISGWLKQIVSKYDPEFQLEFATAPATHATPPGCSTSGVKVKTKERRQGKLNLNIFVGINAKVSK